MESLHAIRLICERNILCNKPCLHNPFYFHSMWKHRPWSETELENCCNPMSYAVTSGSNKCINQRQTLQQTIMQNRCMFVQQLSLTQSCEPSHQSFSLVFQLHMSHAILCMPCVLYQKSTIPDPSALHRTGFMTQI